jgi:hypothetical protein
MNDGDDPWPHLLIKEEKKSGQIELLPHRRFHEGGCMADCLTEDFKNPSTLSRDKTFDHATEVGSDDYNVLIRFFFSFIFISIQLG